jgi:adenylosuccinate synthase
MALQLLERGRELLKEYQLGRSLSLATIHHERQIQLMLNPTYQLEADYRKIYVQGNYQVGWPEGMARIYDHLARENTYAVLGAVLGDEGKGRIVDNIMSKLATIKGIKIVYVTRFQGGGNAGHNVEHDDKRITLHQIPSIPFEPDNISVVGIMDSMMTVHPEELKTEFEEIEKTVGTDSMKGRLILSRDAMLNTDLDRAEEYLLDVIQYGARGKSGSTGRGIRTSVAHHYDQTGLTIKDLMRDDWETALGKKYDDLNLDFSARGMELAEIEVADYGGIVNHTGDKRKLGNRKQYLQRLGETRNWLKEKDLVQNTFPIHLDALKQIIAGSAGGIDEGAQAMGLHPWLGTLTDTTSTDTSAGGIIQSTKLWQIHDIKYRTGVFKATYNSSVGRRRMPTDTLLDKAVKTLAGAVELGLSKEKQWAAWIREYAKEFGATTGRPRDICFIDLPMLAYNCLVGDIEMLAATHLDVARKGEKIKVCTHYLKDGHVLGYQPGLEYQEGVIPQYVELDGWDGEEVKKAKTFDQLPTATKQYLAFIQARAGVPIVFTTTGPDRDQKLEIPDFPSRGTLFTTH